MNLRATRAFRGALRADSVEFARATPLLVVGLAVAYFGLSMGTFAVVDPNAAGSAWWPASGMTLATLCLVRKSHWPMLLLAVGVADVAADLFQHTPFLTSLVWAASNCLEPLLGAVALRIAFQGRVPQLDNVPRVLTFFAVSAVAGPPVSALVGSVAVVLTSSASLFPTWPRWMLGDILGIFVVAPVILHGRDLRRVLDLGLGALLTAIAGITLFVFSGLIAAISNTPYLVGPAMIAVASLYGTAGAASGGLVMTVVATMMTVRGLGPFAVSESGYDALVSLQIFIGVMCLAIHVLAAVRSERNNWQGLTVKLSDEQMHDPLTGVGNVLLLRRALGDTVGAMAGGPSHQSVSVLFLDLDGFKSINDRYGHQIGDEVLRIVALRVRESVRLTDTVSRLGGDEFAVICPAMSEQPARDLAQRITQRVSEPMSVGDLCLTVGVSIGVTGAEGATTTPADLLKAADRDMYRVKAEHVALRHGPERL